MFRNMRILLQQQCKNSGTEEGYKLFKFLFGVWNSWRHGRCREKNTQCFWWIVPVELWQIKVVFFYGQCSVIFGPVVLPVEDVQEVEKVQETCRTRVLIRIPLRRIFGTVDGFAQYRVWWWVEQANGREHLLFATHWPQMQYVHHQATKSSPVSSFASVRHVGLSIEQVLLYCWVGMMGTEWPGELS